MTCHSSCPTSQSQRTPRSLLQMLSEESLGQSLSNSLQTIPPMPILPSRGTLGCWLFSFPLQCRDIKPRSPSGWPSRSGRECLRGSWLSQLNHHHLWQVVAGSHHSIWVIHFLSPRHWDQSFSFGDQLSLFFCCQRRESFTSLTKSYHLAVFLGYFPYPLFPSDNNKSCPLAGKGPPN